MTAKEEVLERLARWTERDAKIALRAVEREHDTDRRRAEIDAAIVDSYTQVPQEDLGAHWAARHSIREEPWTSAS